MSSPNVVLQDAVRSVACDAECAMADGGSIVLLDAGNTILSTFDLESPAFDPAAAGVAALAGVPILGSPAVAGVATKYRVRDNADTVLWEGTVGVSGANWNMANPTIIALQVVPLVGLSHNVPDGA